MNLFRQRKKNQLKKIVAIGLSTLAVSSLGYANEVVDEYELDTVVVTAQRYEKKDIDVAASTDVYTAEDLHRTGARNVQQALSMATGLVYEAKGPGGVTNSTMTSKIIIRGVEKGTLVLINGTPLNLRGLYNLEDIPLESIERIEVVKGGGSVLYGSEATGGVINIITKKSSKGVSRTSISTGFGNYGQENYNLNVQENKVGFSYTYDKWGEVNGVSQTQDTKNRTMETNCNSSEKNNFTLNYSFDDKWDMVYMHDEALNHRSTSFADGWEDLSGTDQIQRRHKFTKDFLQFNYKSDDVTGNVFYNANSLDSTAYTFYTTAGKKNKVPILSTNTLEKNRTSGFDIQKVWEQENGKILFGTTYQNEVYKPNLRSSADKNRSRNNFSVYGQWETELNDSDTFTLSGRESWTTGADEDKNFNNFSAQGQFLHKINEDESIYASIGQSFVMPTFGQMYSKEGSIVIGNADLRPQTGMHYELGWKKNHEDHKWRVALFNYTIKDNISSSAQKVGSETWYYYMNEDLRNTGIELSAEVKENNGWSYNYGVVYNNPESKFSTDKPGAKTYWDRNYGRWQLNGGVTYQKEQWTASLMMNYLADRVITPSSEHSYKVKPYLLANLNVDYQVDDESTLSLSVENLFNRKDIISHASETFATPTNYMLKYKRTF